LVTSISTCQFFRLTSKIWQLDDFFLRYLKFNSLPKALSIFTTDNLNLTLDNQQSSLTQFKDFNLLEFSLAHYIAGLIEGDGSIKVPNSLRSDKNKLLYPSVTIVFVDKDLPLANALATYLKGTVNKAKGNYYVLSIYSLSALYNFAGMVNGKFRTPKIEALHRLIIWLNNNGKFEPLELKGLDNSDIFSNSWFSGFSDCDSNFLITFNLTDNIAKNIQLTYRISQKQDYQQNLSKGSNTTTTLKLNTENIDCEDLNLSQTINPIINEDLNIFKDERSYSKANSESLKDQARKNSYFPILSLIAQSLNTKATYFERKRILAKKDSIYIEKGYLVTAKSLISRLEVIDYFTKFPLLSSKHMDYLSWNKAHEIAVSKRYRTLEGTAELVKLKSSMNSQRTEFNWSHLSQVFPSKDI
jgi:hypothetical protein